MTLRVAVQFSCTEQKIRQIKIQLKGISQVKISHKKGSRLSEKPNWNSELDILSIQISSEVAFEFLSSCNFTICLLYSSD